VTVPLIAAFGFAFLLDLLTGMVVVTVALIHM
jgi:hypothetical protein